LSRVIAEIFCRANAHAQKRRRKFNIIPEKKQPASRENEAG
jgi:hypothetical protein